MGGGLLEEAVVAAITAMNEPKTCSIATLRKFLVENGYFGGTVLFFSLIGTLFSYLMTCMRIFGEQSWIFALIKGTIQTPLCLRICLLVKCS